MKASKRFFIRLFIFVLPFALATIFAFLTALYLGEAIPHSIVLNLPYDAPVVYLPNWEEGDYANFKLEASLFLQPEVIVTGSSRSEHIPHQIFNQTPLSFYNAGIGAARMSTIWQYVRILHQEKALPSLLIIALDYPNFNGTDDGYLDGGDYEILLPNLVDNLRIVSDGTLNIGRAWLNQRELLWGALSQDNGIEYWGLKALERSVGYRPDGSIYNGRINEETIQLGIDDHENRFFEQRGMYRIGATAHENSLAQVEDILRWAQESNTVVVAYFPPYRSGIYEAMLGSGEFAYMNETYTRLSNLFARYEYPLFDFSELSAVQGSDEELYDGWHPGQLLNMRIFLEMCRQAPEIFAPYIDPVILESQIKTATNPFYIFTPE